jgi:hypothetical protein
MDNKVDFLVDSPFIRSMIINDDKYAFDIIDISGTHEGRLNFLIKVVKGISYRRLIRILDKCAKENLIDAFVLVFYLRDCRGGKGERALGRKALQWLAINYPQQFAKVLKFVPEYGRWDDLFVLFPNAILLNRMDNYLSKDVDIDLVKNIQSLAVKMYASRLQEDIKVMKIGGKISLAGKWAPTENDKNDQQYEIVDVLCNELNVSKAVYRKRILSPLRKYLKLVEHSLQNNVLSKIQYDKIPNVAFQKYYNVFKKRDEISFSLYLKTTNITHTKTSNPFPHDILKEYDIFNTHSIKPVVEEKWSYFLQHYKRVHINKIVPILHTSPSFYNNKDMFLRAISLALFICRKGSKPFNNLIIRNHKTQFHYIPEQEDVFSSLKQLIEYSDQDDIDIVSVMKKVAENAKENNLQSNEMPDMFIYICDSQHIQKQMRSLQFNTQSKMVQKIQNIFEECGYVMPKIVFFNMNASSTCFPILSNHHNVGMISGYSPQVLNSLLHNHDELFTCKTILNNILYKERYHPLRNLIK